MRGNRTALHCSIVGLVAVVSTGCAFGVADREIIAIEGVSADGRSVVLTVASCNGDPTAEVEESGDRVVVQVRGDTTTGDCADGVCIELARPLDERPVVDATTDEPVPPSEGFSTVPECA